jgi:hypothetical protein
VCVCVSFFLLKIIYFNIFVLILELVLNENLKEAFIIGVDEKAKDRLNKLTASNKVTPIDLDYLNTTKMVQEQISCFNTNTNKMTTFLPTNNKRAAPLAPIIVTKQQQICSSLSSSRFSSTLSSASSTTSSSSSSTTNNNNLNPIQTSPSTSSNHSKSSNNCSASSSSSVSAASPPPSPIEQDCILLDDSSNHREMAIDCPDYFIPEIKTRPCYPPQPPQLILNNNLVTDQKSNENLNNFVDYELFEQDNQFLESVTKVLNLNITQSTLNDPPITTKTNSTNAISSSMSSIQYIDEDSKLILLNTPNKSPVLTNNKSCKSIGKKLFEKQHDKLNNNSNFIRNSLRSNSFKQKPLPPTTTPIGMINNAFEMEIDNFEVDINIKCKEEEEEEEKIEEITTKVSQLQVKLNQPVHLYQQNNNNNTPISKHKLTNHLISSRAPTPPPRSTEKHLSFFVEQQQEDTGIQLREIYETNNYENTIQLYNKIIKLNSKLELKPVEINSNKLSQDVMKLLKSSGSSVDNELCMLLSKFNNLFNTHDQISVRFEEQKIELQKENKQLMIDQQQNQQDEDETLEISVDLTKQNEDDNDETIHNNNNNNNDDELLISDEGRFLLNKAQHYSVENLKLVNIEKPDSPFGATIRNRDGNIVIGRIVSGGAAQQSGLLHEEDEILEINNIPVRGKTINDVCDMLVNIYLIF